MQKSIGQPLVLALMVVAAAAAQPATRRATTVEALRLYPGFYNGQAVVVRGEVVHDGDRVLLRGSESEIGVVSRDPLPDAREVEVRGQFVDVGRLTEDDPRIQTLGLQPLVQALYRDEWPRPGVALVLSATSVQPATPPPAPSIRSLALDPLRYDGQRITVTGQFRGRNLYGDLPDAPGSGGQDFVIRSADAAIWIVGVKPKGKGFALNPDTRVDTGRWVEVSGLVRHGRGLVWLEGQQIALAQPPAEPRPSEFAAVVPAPPAPPIEVVFSSPVADDADVPQDRPIRIQFSRNIDRASLEGRVRVFYSADQSRERGEPQPPALDVTITYEPSARALLLTPTRPFERFRTVTVELLDGIAGTDGGALKPFRLVFGVGGS